MPVRGDRATSARSAGGHPMTELSTEIGPYRCVAWPDPENDLIADFQIQQQHLFPESRDWATVASGNIRWDGGMNWGHDGCRLHHCGADEIGHLAECLRWVYQMAPELVCLWEGD